MVAFEKIGLILSGFVVGLSLLLSGASSAKAQSMPEMWIPIYGNWCGLDHPTSFDGAGAPVDALDAACRRHDYCAAARGDFDCGCDIGLMGELRSTRWGDPVIASHARAIYDGIAMKPCSAPDGMAFKQSQMMSDMMRDMANGRAAPLNAVERWRRLLLGD